MNERQYQRHLRRFLPQLGHWDATTGVNAFGSRFVVLHLAGHATELADPHAIRATQLIINQALRSIGNPRVEVWDHFVRLDHQPMTALPPAGAWFGDRFDAAYRQAIGGRL